MITMAVIIIIIPIGNNYVYTQVLINQHFWGFIKIPVSIQGTKCLC